MFTTTPSGVYEDASLFGSRFYSVEKMNLRLRLPNSCEQYVEICPTN